MGDIWEDFAINQAGTSRSPSGLTILALYQGFDNLSAA